MKRAIKVTLVCPIEIDDDIDINDIENYKKNNEAAGDVEKA